MNTQDSTNPSPTASQARVLPTENDQVVDSMAAKDEPRTLRAAVANLGRSLGWIERTLLSGTEATNLRREIEARGRSIPVLTVSPRACLGEAGGAS